MNRFATVVAGRRSKFLVLGAWVLLVLALGPFAGRFEQAQRNEPSSFLPEGAESVEVLEAAAGFPSGEVTPAVAVFRDPDGIAAEPGAPSSAREAASRTPTSKASSGSPPSPTRATARVRSSPSRFARRATRRS